MPCFGEKHNRGIGAIRREPLFAKRQSVMPTQLPKTTETDDAKASNKYDYLADRFSTALSFNTKEKDKTSAPEHGLDSEDFLLEILGWDPAWLSGKYRNSETLPPVVTGKSISPIPLKFENHRDYCGIMEPLLALEFWEQISKAMDVGAPKYRTSVGNQRPAHIKCTTFGHCEDFEETRTSRSHSRSRQSIVTLKGVVSREDFDSGNYPDYGDLVLVEQKKAAGSETQKPLKIFAYVDEMDTAVMNLPTVHKNSFVRYGEKPYAVLTYSIYIKPTYLRRVRASRVCTIRKIFHLRSSLRMIRALRYLPHSPLQHKILHPKFENLKLSEISSSEPRSLVTQDQLNSRQLAAVTHVTDAVSPYGYGEKIFLIQGPPGTGKSKVIVNVVTEILCNNRITRILVCAPSNTAVDEIVRRLLDVREKIPKLKECLKMVRMGQKKSMDSQIAKEVSLEALVLEKMALIREAHEKERRLLEAEINAQLLELKEAQAKGDPTVDELKNRLSLRQSELSSLICRQRAVLNEMEQEKRPEISVLKEVNVIACTLNSCFTNSMESTFGSSSENRERVSFCIVDEATQCMEAECLIPLMLGVRTLVLVGDTNQLPATVISQKAKGLGLDQSLFARIQKCFSTKEENPVMLLDTQYRMSPPVASWPNQFFYDGLLINSATVENLPFHYYKVLDHDAKQNRDKFSNTDEAAFVVNLLQALMDSSRLNDAKTPVRVGIITPYNNQKKLINDQIQKWIDPLPEETKSQMLYEVNTVDGFQGQERDVIIMSCVRSNGIGFMSDRHRLCVALTRAKHSTILCGNFKTFEENSMWNALLSDAKTRGAYLKIEATARPHEIEQHVFR